MARNPLYAIIWLAILFFLAWPIAAACCGVRQLSKSPAFYLQIGCAAASAGAAGRSPAIGLSTVFKPFSYPLSCQIFSSLIADLVAILFRCGWSFRYVSRVIYMTKYSIIFVPQRNLLSPLPQSHSKDASDVSGT